RLVHRARAAPARRRVRLAAAAPAPAARPAGHAAGAAVRVDLGAARDPEALRAQRGADDAGGEARPVELALADEALAPGQRLGRVEQAQPGVGEAHVARRARDAAVLDAERPVARDAGQQRGPL